MIKTKTTKEIVEYLEERITTFKAIYQAQIIVNTLESILKFIKS